MLGRRDHGLPLMVGWHAEPGVRGPSGLAAPQASLAQRNPMLALVDSAVLAVRAATR